MISISFPTNGSWQLGKFVNTEEDVNGYITLKNQGTYIEITNNTGQDLSGKPFFIEFIGPDFDTLKWELTPLHVKEFKSPDSTVSFYVVSTDGSSIYTNGGLGGEERDVLFIMVPLETNAMTIEYTTDGETYYKYADVPAGIDKFLPVNHKGTIIGQHIYFTDQYGNILKFWRVAFDYLHKYTAYIIQLKTIDDVPVLFTNGSTIRIYIMTNATSSYAQEIMYPPFLVIHPQIPGYIAGGYMDTLIEVMTIYSNEMIITQDYFTGIDTTRRLCMEIAYYMRTARRNPWFGFLQKYHTYSTGETKVCFTEFTPGWIIDVEISDVTGWEESDCFVQLGYLDVEGDSSDKLTGFRAYIKLESSDNIYYGLSMKGELVNGNLTYKEAIINPPLNQRFLGCFTGAFKLSQYEDNPGDFISCSGYVNNQLCNVNEHIEGSLTYNYGIDHSRFRLYLTNGIKVYRIMQFGFVSDVFNILTEDTDVAKMDSIIRFHDIPRNFIVDTVGYWLSPIIDLGMRLSDFSVSWVADETYGRVDTDNIDPKEIEWRYSDSPPDGMAAGVFIDSDDVEHAYWDPETAWDTASEWQKIESNEQLLPYRYIQFRISLLAS